MPFYFFIWNDEIIEHLADNDITPDEFESVVQSPDDLDSSQSSGRPAAFGYTADGRYVICIYELEDEVTVLPITAYEIEE